MALSTQKAQIQALLKESIETACRKCFNDLQDAPLSIEALIGITSEEEDLMLISIKETLLPTCSVQEFDIKDETSHRHVVEDLSALYDNGELIDAVIVSEEPKQHNSCTNDITSTNIREEPTNEEGSSESSSQADMQGEMQFLIPQSESQGSTIQLPEKLWELINSGKCSIQQTSTGQLVTAPVTPEVQQLMLTIEQSQISFDKILDDGCADTPEHQYSTSQKRKSDTQLKREYRSRKKMRQEAQIVTIDEACVIEVQHDVEEDGLVSVDEATSLPELLESSQILDSSEVSVVMDTVDVNESMPNKDDAEWVCSICDKKLNSKRNLQMHMLGIHAPPQYKCNECGEEFPQKLKNDKCRYCLKGDKLPTKTYSCLGCGADFNRRFLLMRHRDQCVKTGINPTNINEFMEKVEVTSEEENKVHNCSHCKWTSSNEDDLKNHMKTEHPTIVRCSGCGVQFDNLTLLKHHKKFCLSVTNLEAKKPPKEYVCEICGRNYNTSSRLQDHMKGIHKEPSYICSCGSAFRWRSSLNKHKEKCQFAKPEDGKIPRRRAQPKDSNMIYQCSYCNAIYKSDNGLKCHIESKHKQKAIYSCLVCTKTFATRSALTRHRDHCPPKQKEKRMHVYVHKCKICSAEFKDKGSLVKHIKGIHFEGKHLECSLCGEKFNWASSLGRHRLVCKKRIEEGEDNNITQEKFISVVDAYIGVENSTDVESVVVNIDQEVSSEETLEHS